MIRKSALFSQAAIAVALCSGLTFSVSACSAQGATFSSPCGVVIDGSASGAKFDATKRLNDLLPGFLLDKTCKTLTFVPLDGSSQGSVCSARDIDLNPDLGGDTDPNAVRTERRAKALSLAESVLACARKSPLSVGGSDILGALARAVTQRPDGTGTYHVLVVSDLIEDDGTVNLYRTDSIGTPERRANLISYLGQHGRIPNMTDMSLEISDRGRNYSSNPADSVNFTAFWAALFASKPAGNPQVKYD